MSVSNVGSASALWQGQHQPATRSSTAATKTADTTVDKSGPASFRKSLPANIQSLLAPEAETPTAPSNPAGKAATTRPSVGMHHPHHHKGGGSDPLTSPGSAFAADVTQALQAYRAKMPTKLNTSTLA